MKLSLKTIATLFVLSGLAACSTIDPAGQHASEGTIERFVDPQTQVADLPPCLAGRITQIQGGTRFVAIRYRHWASHFRTTVYAEVPAGMRLQLHQEVRITPGQCAHGELAVILQNGTSSTSGDAM